MASTSPKRKRLPSLPLDTQRPAAHHLLDDDYDDVESPRTKVSKKLDTLELDGQLEHTLLETSTTPQQNTRLSCHSELTALSAGASDSIHSHEEGLPSTTPIKSDTEELNPVSLRSDSNSKVSKSLRPKSPPLVDGEVSDIFWHDSEITGHDPDDPNDDGYGINGIGFRPTPALAWSRAQRRKQQLTDLKNREGREARQQRSERRKRFLSESDDASANESSPRKSARVHFEDG